MVSSNTPLSHFMVPTRFLWVSKWQAIKDFHFMKALKSGKDAFLSSLCHCLHELDQQNAAKLMNAPRSKIAKSVPSICW